MTGFVIIVDFTLAPGSRPAFRKLIDRNARDSSTKERGCRRFDVLEPAGEPDRVLLYEIYDDRVAFDAHLQSDHFRRFNADSNALVTRKSIIECDLVCEGAVELSE
jgi:quinol monooxygenase YgiN